MATKDKKKKYLIPEVEIVEFTNEDIITLSGLDEIDWGNEEEEPFELE